MMCVCHNSFFSGDHKFTGDYFHLSDGQNLWPSHIYLLHIIINIFPQNTCIHYVPVIKKIVKYNSEIHSFLHPADAFHPCKLISRNRPVFFI